jgi:hypothetical protein
MKVRTAAFDDPDNPVKCLDVLSCLCHHTYLSVTGKAIEEAVLFTRRDGNTSCRSKTHEAADFGVIFVTDNDTEMALPRMLTYDCLNASNSGTGGIYYAYPFAFESDPFQRGNPMSPYDYRPA